MCSIIDFLFGLLGEEQNEAIMMFKFIYNLIDSLKALVEHQHRPSDFYSLNSFCISF